MVAGIYKSFKADRVVFGWVILLGLSCKLGAATFPTYLYPSTLFQNANELKNCQLGPTPIGFCNESLTGSEYVPANLPVAVGTFPEIAPAKASKTLNPKNQTRTCTMQKH
jgi:hypothetical protein